MTPQETWYADGSKAAKLAVLLQDPILAEAMAVVKDTNSPSRANTSLTGSNPNAAISAFHFQNGLYHAFDDLAALTQPVKTRKVLQPKTLESETLTNP